MRIGLGLHLANFGGGGGGAPWQPSDLGAKLRLDFNPASGLSLSGADVTSWTDTVQSFPITQASSGLKPDYSATGLNGNPAVTGDGTDDYLQAAVTALPVAIPTGAAECEMWALVNQPTPSGTPGTATFFNYGSTSAINQRRLERVVASGANRAQLNVGGTLVRNDNVVFTGIHVLRGRVGAATSTLEVDGVSSGVGVAVVPATGTNRMAMCSLIAGTVQFSPCAIARVIVTVPLDAGEAASMLAYLKAIGGIS